MGTPQCSARRAGHQPFHPHGPPNLGTLSPRSQVLSGAPRAMVKLFRLGRWGHGRGMSQARRDCEVGRCWQEGWEDTDGSGRCSSHSHPWAGDAAGTTRARTPSPHTARSGVGVTQVPSVPSPLPTALAHPGTGGSPDVGLVLVVLAGKVARRALVGDAHHGDLLAVACQVARRGAAAALLAVLHRRVWGHAPIGMAALPWAPPWGQPAGPPAPHHLPSV